MILLKKVKDWDTLKATAEELKSKGYYTFSSYADTFRVYGNNISEPWVTTGETTVKVDQKIMDWIESSKEWLDAGYLDKTVKGQFNDDWNKAMGSSSKVFAFHGLLQILRRNITGAVHTSMRRQARIILNM